MASAGRAAGWWRRRRCPRQAHGLQLPLHRCPARGQGGQLLRQAAAAARVRIRGCAVCVLWRRGQPGQLHLGAVQV